MVLQEHPVISTAGLSPSRKQRKAIKGSNQYAAFFVEKPGVMLCKVFMMSPLHLLAFPKVTAGSAWSGMEICTVQLEINTRLSLTTRYSPRQRPRSLHKSCMTLISQQAQTSLIPTRNQPYTNPRSTLQWKPESWNMTFIRP